MAKIEGQITIGRPVDVAFDYVADQTNEPQYNPAMVRAEKETAGPIGRQGDPVQVGRAVGGTHRGDAH